MRVANGTNKTLLYTTWYDFRKELGKRLGHTPLALQWLELKPTDPLPWNDSHMKAAISAAVSFGRAKGCSRKRQRELTVNRSQLGQ